jgi:type IV pilus assembly protein PilA
MKNKQKKLTLKNFKGFTLIEILVVIGIIAILATIVLIAINPARQFRQARDTQRTSNVNAILNAIGQYIADNKGAVPSGMPAAAASPSPISDSGANLCTQLVPKYISSLPVDPAVTSGPIPSPCTTPYDTQYNVSTDASGRITVYADGEEPAGTNNISVTR